MARCTASTRRARAVQPLRAERRGYHGDEGLRRRPAVLGKDLALRRGADAGAVHPLCADAPGRGQHTGRVRYRGPRGRGRFLRNCHRGRKGLRERARQRPAHAWRGQCTYCGTAPPAPPASTSPWSTSSTIWPPCRRKSRRRCARTTSSFPPTRATAWGCKACEARVPLRRGRSPAAWRRRRSCLGRKSRPARAALTCFIAHAIIKGRKG